MSAIEKRHRHLASATKSGDPALQGARMKSSATIIDGERREGSHSVSPRRYRAAVPADFKTATLQVRVSHTLKTEASKTLEALGLSLPEAIRVFLGRIVRDQAFPFPLESPNPDTAAGLRESMASDHKRFTSASELFHDLGKGGVD